MAQGQDIAETWSQRQIRMAKNAPPEIRAWLIGFVIYPPALTMHGQVFSMAEVRNDGDGRGDYVHDRHNRRWLLDGSGDVA